MKGVRKILLDAFCLRQFDKKGGYMYIDCASSEFEEKMDKIYKEKLSELKDGYAPFCKHLIVLNWTSTVNPIMKITPENEALISTEYEARSEKELPVLIRYIPATKISLHPAKYLDVILYSREQIRLENEALGSPTVNEEYDYGIVSVKPQDVDYEIPMQPITAMRNALGKEQGGSGIPINFSEYMKSVNFWKDHVTVKP